MRPTRGGEDARAEAPPAARADDAVERDRRRRAFERMRAAIFGDEQSGCLALDGCGDEHGSWLGSALDARGNIGRFAEHFAGRVDHRRAAIEADARGELGQAFRGVPGGEVSERALDGEGRAHGPLGVVLLRVRIAEQRHQPVAEFFQDVAAEARHRRRGPVEIGPDRIAPVFRVEPRRERRRTDQIAEHDRDRAALGQVNLRKAGPD